MIPSRKLWAWPPSWIVGSAGSARSIDAGECSRTRLDAIPWSELFRFGRRGGPHLVRDRRRGEK